MSGVNDTGRSFSLGMLGGPPRYADSYRIFISSERFALGAETFEIVVRGRLSPTLLTAIEGFEVSSCDKGFTHLVGWVPDQARLHSLLELLRDLNIELTSVNPIGPLDRGLGGDEKTRGDIDG
jgi:hypothetical protein